MYVRMSRRQFLRGTALAGAGAALAPRHLLAAGAPAVVETRSPNAKLNVACIGVAGRGGSHLGGAARENLVAICDIDDKNLDKVGQKYPNAKKYFDYRKMFDEMHKGIDAVVVATPDHQHAPASMMAIKLGKHVYCEKPLTHSIYEARMVAEAAKRNKVATQMGNQGHSGGGYHALCEFIWTGAIGDVTEAHCQTNRPIWPQDLKRPTDCPEAPANIHWDEWLGPAPKRPYHPCYLPFKWRGWWDFGCGALGDMACHIMDGAMWALQLGHPTSVELVEVLGGNDETFPKSSVIRWDFPARKATVPTSKTPIEMRPVKVFWHDGGKTFPTPEEVGRDFKIDGGGASFYLGDKGKMYTGCYGGGVTLLPIAKMKDYPKPERVLPRPEGGHFGDWINACKTGKEAGSNFSYAGPFTEVVLLGNLAIRAGAGKKVEWDGPNMKVTNMPELNRCVKREYREGWTL
jgi:predicted dehydrogenase